ncbi:Glu-tRNA(Gln) amidotransferase subunit GatE [Candidatus Woesearchaeota archaeon]|nr:Glu-tRNA(Gln) amidotransferase subunit GatE [Candidatus Woesearchaeota archaeon]
MDYKKLNLKVGLEIHRQINSHKLFCKCPSILSDGNPDLIVKRKLRAVESEMGEKDRAAIFEMLKDKKGVYEFFNESACLIELDEEPILGINEEALKAVLTVAKMLNCEIFEEIIMMRKQVLDYSNTTGFQRTGLVARNGYVKVNGNKIRIESICIEEDSARKIKINEKEAIYRLDRLGIPLIEITTSPDMNDAEEVKEVASYLGMILKSTGKFKSGLGTIRQDINISIKNGKRVEIKGVQDLRNIPKIIENEIERQLKEKANEEVRVVNSELKTDFLRPMPGAARMYVETDIDEINTSSLLNEVKIPRLIKDEVDNLVKKGLSENIAREIVNKGIDLDNYKLDSKLVADVLIEKPKEIRKRFKIDVKEENLEKVLDLLKNKKINRDVITDVLIDMENDKFEISNYKKIDNKLIENEVRNLMKNNLSVKAMMGILMGKYKGKISGKELMEIIKKYEK